ncbi:MAG: hypothetical protein HY735_17885 [Verrucomicrobia bacterium]|nr:hypothetical protein [Verrucomicrobiota bacterium]
MRSEPLNPFAFLEPLSESVCPKCGHHNAGTAETCEVCHRHLLIFCGHCGHPNYRGADRCVECRTQLHIRGRPRWQAAKARKWIQPMELLLFLVAVLLTAGGVVKLANWDLPKREAPPPQVYVLKPDGTWYLR